MPRRKKSSLDYENLLQRYARSRNIDAARFDASKLYFDVIDKGYSRVRIYPSGKYYIVYAKYWRITKGRWPVRKGERGILPKDPIEIARFLDHIFFDADVLEERRLTK